MLGQFTGQNESDSDIIVSKFFLEQERATYEVWISREEIVDFLLYAASLEASVATRSKMSKKRVSDLQVEFLRWVKCAYH